jgi:hypothetical protein
MTATNAAAAAKEPEPTSTATAGLTAVTPDLIQQLLEHDYLKLKIKAQVDELTNAKLTRWRKGLLAAASAAVVVLGYLGIQANQIVNDFNQKAEKVHDLQDKIVAAQTKVNSDSERVGELVTDAKDNAHRSTVLVSSSLDFLRDNIKQLNTVNATANEVTRGLRKSEDKLTESEKRLEAELNRQRDTLKTKLDEANQAVSAVNPLLPAMQAAANASKDASKAAEEARKAGTFEIVFLESNSNRTVDLTDYEDPARKFNVKFTTNHIKARANVDVETIVDGQKFPVQHLGNLTVGEVQTIEHTSLRVEVSALRHHRQPFLHSFLILRVFSAKRAQRLVAEKTALANDATNQE